MKPGKPLRRTRLRQWSDKRIAADAELAVSRRAVEIRSGGWCEAGTPDCPSGRHRGEHVHHVVPRSRGGVHDPANLKMLCRAAHEFAHAHPNWARQHGLTA